MPCARPSKPSKKESIRSAGPSPGGPVFFVRRLTGKGAPACLTSPSRSSYLGRSPMAKSPRYHRTAQRAAILDHITARREHLSAEEIHSALRRRHPRLSVSSVYRNLKVLVEQGNLRVLRFGSGQDLYDARTDPHYHVLCHSCSSLHDVELPALAETVVRAGAQLPDFRMDGHTLIFVGVCRTCEGRSLAPGTKN